MPLLRRRSDPRELGEVLRRLERLRVPPSAVAPTVTGWVPRDAHSAQWPVDEPPSPEVDVQSSPSARLSGVRLHAFDPGRRGVAVLVVVAALGAGGGGWYFVHAAPHAARDSPSAVDAVPRAPTSPALPSAPAAWATPAASSVASPSTDTATVVVDVVGKVAHAGVVTLPAGARVVDAIAAAGGVLPNTDLTALDLAGKVLDGAEIFVGIPPPSGAAAQAAGGVIGGAGGDTSGSSTGGASAPAIVNLNTATEAELETLPGVGLVTAQRIVAWRTQHQRFTSVVQLQQVSGIGPAKYAALVGHVTI